jgi:hypothetical protein
MPLSAVVLSTAAVAILAIFGLALNLRAHQTRRVSSLRAERTPARRRAF